MEAPRPGRRTNNPIVAKADSSVPAGTQQSIICLSRWFRFASPPANFPSRLRREFCGAYSLARILWREFCGANSAARIINLSISMLNPHSPKVLFVPFNAALDQEFQVFLLKSLLPMVRFLI
jgi:hypothetical protein